MTVFRFEGCSVDIARREVRLHGRVQHLEPQAFDVLAYLLAHAERVVPKAELLEQVWGNQFVSESALTTRVKELRRAIGDDGRAQRLVRNVRGRGYRFIGDLAPLASHRSRTVAEPILGRVDDIAGVTRLFSTSALVTLVGAGGVGKTRLAVEVAAELGDRGTDGSFFVDLSALASPQAVVPTLLRAVNVQIEGDGELAALRALSHLDALVVLDNCEHLIEAAAAAVQAVLGFAGRVRILATSRERLGVTGERVWPVAPLDLTAARQLFLDRARAVSPGFDGRLAELAMVDRIVDAVDRLPLAIEMAAARVGVMGLAELASLVTARVELLRSPVRGTTDRHRTLTSVIAWSAELLDESERAAFADLSVFAAPAMTADLQGVISGGGAVDRVCRLVDKSLVIAEVSDGPTRYRMLETVRRHAATRVGDVEALSGRHAKWFTEAAEAADALLRTPDELQGHEQVEARVDELRAAHGWARSHAPQLAARLTAALQLFAHTRLWSEPAQWATALAPLVDNEPYAAHVWAAMANAAAHQGRLDAGVALADQALGSTDRRAVAVALEALADIAMYSGDLVRCQTLGRQLRDLGERIGDRHATALGHVDEALALTYGGDPVAALDLLDRLDRGGYAPSELAWFHYAEGEALAKEDPDGAVAAFERGIDLADLVGNRFLGGVARVSVTSVHARAADPTRALHAFARLIEDWQRLGNITHLVTSLRNLIELFVRVGAHEPAGQLLGALQSREIKGSYGEEAQRLAGARASLEQAVGSRQLSVSMTRGKGRDLRWATSVALNAIEQWTPTASESAKPAGGRPIPLITRRAVTIHLLTPHPG